MIKELFYEWTLCCMCFISGESKRGYITNNKIYEKRGWLDWDVRDLNVDFKINESIKRLKEIINRELTRGNFDCTIRIEGKERMRIS